MRDKRIRAFISNVRPMVPFITAIAIGVITAMAVKAIYKPVIVSGSSMEPTYKSGEVLRSEAVPNMSFLTRGTVAVVRAENKTMIKRIIGLPGETIQICGGYVYINGIKDHTFDFDPIEDPGCVKSPITLDEGEYFLLGDNRNKSNDSRYFGPVSFKGIKARVTGRMW